MSDDFTTWWDDIGSGIRPLAAHDWEQHGRRITMIAWNDSSVRATAELERLRADLAQRTAERDEARREVCGAYGQMAEVLAAAERRGWGCFTTHTNTPDVPVQNGGE